MPRSVADFVPIATPIRNLVVDRIEIDRDGLPLHEALEAHPRLLVAMNHGPVAGPLAALIGLFEAYNDHGGADRIPLGVTWRDFYRLPGVRDVAAFVTQIDHGPSFDECCDLLTNGPFTDMVIMPEGIHANFGDGSVVQEFRTPRFVELAARTGCPILLGAHAGTEAWAAHFPHQPWWDSALPWLGRLGKQIAKAGGVNFSLPHIRLDALRLSFELYEPDATRRALGGSREEIREAVKEDAEAVRVRLDALVRRLRGIG